MWEIVVGALIGILIVLGYQNLLNQSRRQLFSTLTPDQKAWVKKRDRNKCQFVSYHIPSSSYLPCGDKSEVVVRILPATVSDLPDNWVCVCSKHYMWMLDSERLTISKEISERAANRNEQFHETFPR